MYVLLFSEHVHALFLLLKMRIKTFLAILATTMRAGLRNS
jgi:hypothetical protein